MAIGAQAPIVPVAVTGARDAMRKGSPLIWPATVTITFGAAIPSAGLTIDNRDELIARVRQSMQSLLA